MGGHLITTEPILITTAPMSPERRELLLLLELHHQNVSILSKLEGLEKQMTDAQTATADLNAGVAAVFTAVGDASAAIKDLAAKLSGASSVNPGDVESAAAKLNQIAAGLEQVVAEAGEPITSAPASPPPSGTGTGTVTVPPAGTTTAAPPSATGTATPPGTSTATPPSNTGNMTVSSAAAPGTSQAQDGVFVVGTGLVAAPPAEAQPAPDAAE